MIIVRCIKCQGEWLPEEAPPPGVTCQYLSPNPASSRFHRLIKEEVEVPSDLASL